MAASSPITEATVAPSHDSRASRILSYLILAGGLLTVAVMLYLVAISYSPLPFYDQWEEFNFAADGGNVWSPVWLWQRRAEHRHVLPKLFYAADLRFFGASQKFLLSSIFVMQLLHLALLSWSMRRLGGWRGTLWLTGTGVAAFCLFYPSQYDNFVWGWQVCHVLAELLATLSFVTLLLYANESQANTKETSPRFLAISIAAAAGATYSLANGNLLWPILVLAALYLRLRRSAVITLLCAGAVSTGLYFFKYLNPGRHERPIFSNLRAPMRILNFGAEYLFGTWTHHGLLVAIVVVAAELTIAGVVIFLAWKYFRHLGRLGTLLVMMMVFWVVTAMITAAGRSGATGSLFARESRYQTVILLFWCCIALLLLGCAWFARTQFRHGFVAAQIVLLLSLIGGAFGLRYPLAQVHRHGFMQEATSAALMTGVYDLPQMDWTYSRVEQLVNVTPYLRQNRLSIFEGDLPFQLGKRLEYVFPLAPFGRCNGAVESAVPIDTPGGRGLRFTGWAWDTVHQRPAAAIVVARNGALRGFGAVGQWHAGVRDAQPGIPAGYMGYVAYLPQIAQGPGVAIYAVLPGGRPKACFLAAE